jgi:hypothetical protein
MQSGERKLHLPFDSDRAKDVVALSPFGDVLQQCRFTYSRFAA